jgi:hypothetical protein
LEGIIDDQENERCDQGAEGIVTRTNILGFANPAAIEQWRPRDLLNLLAIPGLLYFTFLNVLEIGPWFVLGGSSLSSEADWYDRFELRWGLKS